MILVVSGDTPSKKNGKRIITNQRTGKPMIISSARHNEWERQAIAELVLQFAGYRVTDYPVALSLRFFFKNKRAHDLDNVAASVMDVMTKAGILEDDSTKFVDRLTLSYGGVDATQPRVEIELSE
jgi:Holliday junction resolvase RusA-like endonuclease